MWRLGIVGQLARVLCSGRALNLFPLPHALCFSWYVTCSPAFFLSFSSSSSSAPPLWPLTSYRHHVDLWPPFISLSSDQLCVFFPPPHPSHLPPSKKKRKVIALFCDQSPPSPVLCLAPPTGGRCFWLTCLLFFLSVSLSLSLSRSVSFHPNNPLSSFCYEACLHALVALSWMYLIPWSLHAGSKSNLLSHLPMAGKTFYVLFVFLTSWQLNYLAAFIYRWQQSHCISCSTIYEWNLQRDEFDLKKCCCCVILQGIFNICITTLRKNNFRHLSRHHYFISNSPNSVLLIFDS